MELSTITIGLNPDWELIEAKLQDKFYYEEGGIYNHSTDATPYYLSGGERILPILMTKENERHIEKALRRLKFINMPFPFKPHSPNSRRSKSEGVKLPFDIFLSITGRGTEIMDAGIIECRQLYPPAFE